MNRSRGIRFIDYLIDLILFSFLLRLIILFIPIHPISTHYFYWVIRLFSLIVYFLYYFIFESIWKITPGKLITQSFVSTQPNYSLSAKTIAIRSVCRLIPLEPLSIFLSPQKQCWHDQLSHTIVTKKQTNYEKA